MATSVAVPTVDRSPPGYEQIAEYYRAQMRTGELNVGDVLPPVREMYEVWSVSTHTVQRALKVLRDEGLIQTRAAKRALVVARPAPKPPP